jgi:hypothetical protein
VQEQFTGVCIDSGPQPFQIVQQDAHGLGVIRLKGRWRHASRDAIVQARIVDERLQSPICPWQQAQIQTESDWEISLDQIPAGGLYRTQTRLVLKDNVPEWGAHGDVIHHLGVGDLWVIAGQSNAAGYGLGAVDDPPKLGLHILKNNERWDIAAHPLNDPTGSTHANTEIANPGHSPYLGFARQLRSALGYPIGLIQTALGNSRLSQWNPVENPSAPLYHNLLHCVRLAGGRVRGMLWYQGESDTNPRLAQTYERRFADFVTRLREDLGDPQLPIILAQSNRYTGPQSPEEHRGWSIVREAQRNARKLGNVSVVPTLDLPLSDDCHTSPQGNLLLGHRKAEAALAMVYRKTEASSAPDVLQAVRGIDGRSIELTFSNVATRLQFIAPGEDDFALEDENGSIEVRKVECIAHDRVRLSLARPASPSARVHSALGANPHANLRDVERNMPILAFYGMRVK